MTREPEYLQAIADTALFCPCCGQDLELPVRLFASAVSDFLWRIAAIRNMTPTIKELGPKIAAVTTWLGHMTAWRREFCDRRAALPARAADRTREQEQEWIGLTMSIRNIDFGCEYSNGTASVGALLAAFIKGIICQRGMVLAIRGKLASDRRPWPSNGSPS